MLKPRILRAWRIKEGWRELPAAPHNPVPVLGVGTGRCGTMSLAEIVGACKNTTTLHEGYLADWDLSSLNNCKHMIEAMKMWSHSGVLAANSSFNMLPFVGLVREEIPELRVVCLHRDKLETVRSFERRLGDKPLMDLSGTDEETKYETFPNVVGGWEAYWLMCEEMMAQIPGRYDMQMEDLNSKLELGRLFDYLEIPSEDRVYLEQTRWNVGK